MTELQDFAYWMALAHLPKWRTEKVNKLIVEILHNRKLSFAEFFQMGESDWQSEFQLSAKESASLLDARSDLPDLSSLAEDLLEQGFEIIPINYQDYPETLKGNLKLKYSPPVLYVKGNKQLLREPSVAIVGSRNASEIALQFTEAVAEKCVREYKVVVSGFAKGVDRAALESALKYHGRSIIVLPQGIMTFASGFKKYHPQISEGDVLVLSAYFPKTPWNVGLAMGRNIYIYGLAEEIYVAESGSSGGTWAGVIDGLRKGRKIYVRKPEPDEKNANNMLLSKGAIPVDSEGNLISRTEDKPETKQLEMEFGTREETDQ
jgi:predicted Rossmann fold nucleotide-binding protein DprA/Smf involved in DNA uptake